MLATPPPAPIELAVGQLYACNSAYVDRRLEATVGRIDKLPSGETVVSIYMTDGGPNATIPVVQHSPFSEAQFRASCPHLEAASVPVPSGFEEGYAMWRQAFDSGNGGYFTISVDQALDVTKSTLAQHRPTP